MKKLIYYHFLPTKRLLVSGVLLFTLLLSSCHKEGERQIGNEAASNTTESVNISVRHADFFTVENLLNGHRVTILDPQSHTPLQQIVLLSREEAQLYQPQEKELVITVPCQRMALLSDTFVGALECLDAREQLIATCNTATLYDSTLQQRAAEGLLHSISPSGITNVEELFALHADLVMVNYYQGVEVSLPLDEEAPIPIVYNNDWHEKSLLARAEWIKLLGLLAGKGAVADSLFKEVETRYTALQRKVDLATFKPEIFFGNAYKGTWYLPSKDSYVAKMISDAGGKYRTPETTYSEAGISFEVVLKEFRTAPIWLTWQSGDIKNLSDFARLEPRYKQFEAFKQGKVYLNDARSKGLSNDYFEVAPYRPDQILEDLIAIFHPELVPQDYKLIYWRKLPQE